MNTTVYLIRHGHVDFSLGQDGQPVIYGPRAELSQNGVRQMTNLGESLRNKGVKLERIYTSPLSRAKSSAEILEEESIGNVPIVDVEGLMAKLHPSWEDKSVREFEETGEDLFSQVRPGDETPKEASDRIWEAYQEIMRKNKGRTIAVVTHGEVIRSLMDRLGVHVEIPNNGEGFRLIVLPEGGLLEHESVDAEIPSRGKEKI